LEKTREFYELAGTESFNLTQLCYFSNRCSVGLYSYMHGIREIRALFNSFINGKNILLPYL